jgi:diguanylate cyclase (GGDEF)-like protein
VPVCDPLVAYGLVVLINVDEEALKTKRPKLEPFVVAACNLFNIKHVTHFEHKQIDTVNNSKPHDTIETILSNIYHPVIFFSEHFEIIQYNKHCMNLVQQSDLLTRKDMRGLLAFLSPDVAREIIEAVEQYDPDERLSQAEWNHTPFKINAFEPIQVDIKLIPLFAATSTMLQNKATASKGKQANTIQNNKSPQQFALMINDNKRNESYSLQRFQALTSVIPLGILQMNKDFECVYANDTWSKITTLSMAESLGDNWTRCFEPQGLQRVLGEMEHLNSQNTEFCEELRLASLNAGAKWVKLKSAGLFDKLGILGGYIITLDDVTHLHAQKQALESLASTDSLTGISNRSAFNDRLKMAITRVGRHDNAALLFLDLDKFKLINDTYGHSAGDKVIQKVAQRLCKVTRSEDTIARLGGDEFAIIVSDVRSDTDVVNLAMKIVLEIAKPMAIEKEALNVQCSIGIAPIKNCRSSIKTILKHADLAVYKAKSLGRNQFCMYTESLEHETLLANYLRASLQKNVTAKGFFLEYQPQVNAHTNQIVGVEALSRWHHPKNEVVTPDEFILQLETHGLINDFFVWQLHDLLPQAKQWIASSLISSDCRLSVNLSAVQLHISTFATQLLASFKKAGVDPSCFGLEVTETAFIQDPLIAGENLQILQDAGFHIALDDFGTGFSSLNLLRKMPLNSIKIDKEFIAEILTNKVDAKIVQSMITLSHELNLIVVAEGVESGAVKQWLDEHHCPIQQGFHFYRPMPPNQLESCLKASRPLH